MTDLKTLKDIKKLNINIVPNVAYPDIFSDELREEAKKWIQEYNEGNTPIGVTEPEQDDAIVMWIIHFFNLEETK